MRHRVITVLFPCYYHVNYRVMFRAIFRRVVNVFVNSSYIAQNQVYPRQTVLLPCYYRVITMLLPCYHRVIDCVIHRDMLRRVVIFTMKSYIHIDLCYHRVITVLLPCYYRVLAVLFVVLFTVWFTPLPCYCSSDREFVFQS